MPNELEWADSDLEWADAPQEQDDWLSILPDAGGIEQGIRTLKEGFTQAGKTVYDQTKEGLKEVGRGRLRGAGETQQYNLEQERDITRQIQNLREQQGLERTMQEEDIQKQYKGQQETSEWLKNMSQSEFLKADPDKLPKNFTEHFFRAGPQIITAMATGLLAGPTAAGLGMYGEMFGRKLEELEQREDATEFTYDEALGLPTGKRLTPEAYKAASGSAAVQSAAEAFGVSRALKLWKTKGPLAAKLKQIGDATSTEFFTETIQSLLDRGAELLWLDPDNPANKKFEQFVDELGENVKQGMREGAIAAAWAAIGGAPRISQGVYQQRQVDQLTPAEKKVWNELQENPLINEKEKQTWLKRTVSAKREGATEGLKVKTTSPEGRFEFTEDEGTFSEFDEVTEDPKAANSGMTVGQLDEQRRRVAEAERVRKDKERLAEETANKEMQQLRLNQLQMQRQERERKLAQAQRQDMLRRRENERFITVISEPEGLRYETKRTLTQLQKKDLKPVEKSIVKPLERVHEALWSDDDNLGALKDIRVGLVDNIVTKQYENLGGWKLNNIALGYQALLDERIGLLEEQKRIEEKAKLLKQQTGMARPPSYKTPKAIEPAEAAAEKKLEKMGRPKTLKGQKLEGKPKPEFVAGKKPPKKVVAPKTKEPTADVTKGILQGEKKRQGRDLRRMLTEERIARRAKVPDTGKILTPEKDVTSGITRKELGGKTPSIVQKKLRDEREKRLKEKKPLNLGRYEQYPDVTPGIVKGEKKVAEVKKPVTKKKKAGAGTPTQKERRRTIVGPDGSVGFIERRKPFGMRTQPDRRKGGKVLFRTEEGKPVSKFSELQKEQQEMSPYQQKQLWNQVANARLAPLKTKMALSGINLEMVKSPGNISENIRKQISDDVVAYYDPQTNTIVSFTDRNPDIVEMKRSIWHEMGHDAVRQVSGKDLDSVLNKAKDHYKTDNTIEAEEKLIDDYLKNKKLSLGKRLKNVVTKTANKLGFEIDNQTGLREADIVRTIQKMRNTAGKAAKGKGTPVAAADLPEDEGIRKSVGKSVGTFHGTPTESQYKFRKIKPGEPDYRKHMGPRKRPQNVDAEYVGLSLTQKLKQFFLEPLAAIQKLEEGKDIDAAMSGYISMNMISNFPAIYGNFIRYGIVSYKNHWIQLDPNGKGLEGIVRDLGDTSQEFFEWMTALSAEEMLNKGKVHVFGTDENGNWLDDRKMVNDIKAHTVPIYNKNKKTWDDARVQLRKINKSVLDFAQNAGMIDPATRQDWERSDYIPFYRTIQDPFESDWSTIYPFSQRDTKLIKEFKGSQRNIGDPLTNLFNAYQFILSESLKNLARKKVLSLALPSGVVERLPGKPKQEKHWVAIRHQGKAQYFRVKDRWLWDSITDIDAQTQGTFSQVLRWTGIPKRLLTWGVTVVPGFRIANATKDTLQTAALVKGFVPFWDSIRGAYHIVAKTPEFVEAASQGALFSGPYHRRDVSPSANVKQIKKLQKKLKGKHRLLKYTDAWKFLGELSENAARMGAYYKMRKAGLSVPQAGFETKDILDFHRSGRLPLFRLLIQMIPFLNARIQGLSKLGRTATTRNRNFGKFYLTASVLAIASMALDWLNEDEDWWKSLPLHEKVLNKHWKIGDTIYKIPVPFELGSGAMVMVPSVSQSVRGKTEWGDTFDLFKKVLTDVFMFDPTFQVVRPWVNQVANRDPWTNAPIVQEWKKELSPELQYQRSTSKTFRVLARAMQKVVPDTGFLATEIPQSPARLEKLMKDFVGPFVDLVTAITDVGAQHLMDFPEDPAGVKFEEYMDVMGIGRFKERKGKVPRYTRQQTKFYDFLHEYDRALRTFNEYKKIGNIEKARELRDTKREEIVKGKIFNKIQRIISTVNRRIDQIEQSDKYTPEEKRAEIDKLLLKRQDTFQRVLNRLEVKE